MKYWEIVADKLSAAGWSWGYRSAVATMAGTLDGAAAGNRHPSADRLCFGYMYRIFTYSPISDFLRSLILRVRSPFANLSAKRMNYET